MRRFWIGLGILFVLLVAGLVGLKLWVHSYLRSEAFRQLVSAKTGEALKVGAEYQPLDWSGSSVYSESLKGAGLAGAPIESLDAEQVRANVDWKAIFDGAWRLDRVTIARLDAKIRGGSAPADSGAQPPPAPERTPWRRGLLPNRFELGSLQAQEANIAIVGIAQVRGASLVVQPAGSGWLFDGSGGRLDVPGRPPMEINRFRLRLQEGVVYLTSADLRLGDAGSLAVSGEVNGQVAPYDIQLEWQNVNVADVLDAEWKGRLTGTIAGKARCVGRPSGAPVTTGSFSLADGRLEGLPVQRQIAKFTRSPQFEHMPLQQVSGDFSHDGANATITNFVAESQGLLRIEGGCRIGGDGSVDGVFRVGVTAQSLQWLPGSQEKVFVDSANGYLWTTVKIGGTLQNPTEDLSGRLARAMGEQAIDTGVQLLNQAPSNASDTVDKAVDILKSLVP